MLDGGRFGFYLCYEWILVDFGFQHIECLMFGSNYGMSGAKMFPGIW